MKPKVTEIRKAFSPVAFSYGFRPSGVDWILEGADVVCLLNVDAGRWGGQASLNVAFWLRVLGNLEPPKYNQAHIYLRADEWIEPPLLVELDQALSTDSNMTLAVRTKALALATKSAIARGARLGVIAEMREAFLRGDFANALVRRDARELLEGELVGSAQPLR